jgi:hypothetical protein
MTELYTFDRLCALAERGLPALRAQWRTNKKVIPLLLTWPSKPVKLDDGQFTQGVLVMELPEDRKEWSSILQEMIQRASPSGMLLVEQRDTVVRTLLDTHQGTRCWDLPIQDHGDVVVLGQVQVTSNKERLGVLWSGGSAKN